MTLPLLTFLDTFDFLDRRNMLVLGGLAIIVFLATSVRKPTNRCPSCREVNRDHANYCAQCGTRLKGNATE